MASRHNRKYAQPSYAVVCPACRESRVRATKPAPGYVPLCKACNGAIISKMAAERKTQTKASAGSVVTAPCIDGTQAHEWTLGVGVSPGVCARGCRAVFPPQRFGERMDSKLMALAERANYYRYEIAVAETN